MSSASESLAASRLNAASASASSSREDVRDSPKRGVGRANGLGTRAARPDGTRPSSVVGFGTSWNDTGAASAGHTDCTHLVVHARVRLEEAIDRDRLVRQTADAGLCTL